MVPRGGARSGARRWCPEWCPEEVPGVVPRAATWEVPHGGAPRWCPEGTHVKKHNKTTSGHHLGALPRATLPTSSGQQVGATRSGHHSVKLPQGQGTVWALGRSTTREDTSESSEVGAPSRGSKSGGLRTFWTSQNFPETVFHYLRLPWHLCRLLRRP